MRIEITNAVTHEVLRELLGHEVVAGAQRIENQPAVVMRRLDQTNAADQVLRPGKVVSDHVLASAVTAMEGAMGLGELALQLRRRGERRVVRLVRRADGQLIREWDADAFMAVVQAHTRSEGRHFVDEKG